MAFDAYWDGQLWPNGPIYPVVEDKEIDLTQLAGKKTLIVIVFEEEEDAQEADREALKRMEMDIGECYKATWLPFTGKSEV